MADSKKLNWGAAMQSRFRLPALLMWGWDKVGGR